MAYRLEIDEEVAFLGFVDDDGDAVSGASATWASSDPSVGNVVTAADGLTVIRSTGIVGVSTYTATVTHSDGTVIDITQDVSHGLGVAAGVSLGTPRKITP